MNRRLSCASATAFLACSLLLAHCGSSDSNDPSSPLGDAGGPLDEAGHPITDGGGTTGDGGGTTGDGGGLPPSGGDITPTGTLWYVRTDGGTALQCDGKTDAAYPGSGNAQKCAFSHPHYLWANDTKGETAQWKIASGDTVIIRGGPYRMGNRSDGSGATWGDCGGDTNNCFNPKIPAGVAGKTTKILGENYANCTAKTQFFGGYGLKQVLNLKGAQYVDIACLELTDHSSCSGNNVGAKCGSSDDYASLGIRTDETTANVSLIDIDAHGFVQRGMLGPVGGHINVDHVRFAYNGGGGWDFDDGNGTKDGPGAAIAARYLTIEWNGCNEEYPIAHTYPATTCSDQTSGGYGDGVGTPDTGLDFTCDHCNFNHNTQDGLDLLHISGSTIAISNSFSYANMGQQWKLGPMASVSFQNVLTLHNCRRMKDPITGAPSNYNASLSLFCRAGNGAVSIGVQGSGTYTIENSTLVGYADVDYGYECTSAGTCSGAALNYRNNIVVGFTAKDSGKLPAPLYFGDSSLTNANWKNRSNNIYFNPRACPSGFTAETCVDPKLANEGSYASESDLDAVDFHLSAGSPAIDTGVTISAVKTDYFGVQRPQGAAYDIGAAEHP